MAITSVKEGLVTDSYLNQKKPPAGAPTGGLALFKNIRWTYADD
jgi:hypothetical protein